MEITITPTIIPAGKYRDFICSVSVKITSRHVNTFTSTVYIFCVRCGFFQARVSLLITAETKHIDLVLRRLTHLRYGEFQVPVAIKIPDGHGHAAGSTICWNLGASQNLEVIVQHIHMDVSRVISLTSRHHYFIMIISFVIHDQVQIAHCHVYWGRAGDISNDHVRSFPSGIIPQFDLNLPIRSVKCTRHLVVQCIGDAA